MSNERQRYRNLDVDHEQRRLCQGGRSGRGGHRLLGHLCYPGERGGQDLESIGGTEATETGTYEGQGSFGRRLGRKSILKVMFSTQNKGRSDPSDTMAINSLLFSTLVHG